MDTVITLDVKDAMYLLILIGLLVLLCFFIALVRNLIVSTKSINKILKDTEVITEIAARRATDTDKMLSEASESISTMYKSIKGNQSAVKALSVIINSLISLKNLMTKRKKAKDD